MNDFLRIEIDGKVVCPGIMPKVICEQTNCTVSIPTEGGRMHIDVAHRSEKEIEKIRAVLRELTGVIILDEDSAHTQKNGKANSKATGKK
ncbi:MAG: hypothetical protein PHH13_00310 [Candidatus Peribacteraceae bacterium]|nr:hypothetical protein [Candidatus Peribacteraceae bacterium]